MNSTFKVVFNKARGALMVVNEATSSVQAKGTKTVIAAAVTALMAGGAMAALPEGGVITNDNLPTLGDTADETTKLVSGNGETISIQTNGSVHQLVQDLANAMKGEKLALPKALMDALAPKNGSVIITGVTGGTNFMDKDSLPNATRVLGLGTLLTGEEHSLLKALDQFGYKQEEDQYVGEGAFGSSTSATCRIDEHHHRLRQG